MKIVCQRVTDAVLSVDGKEISRIGKGLCVYFGVKRGDSRADADYLVGKMVNLRVFSDDDGKMNLSVKQIGGEILLISQFTLYGDSTHGNRPSFIEAEAPDMADALYEYALNKVSSEGVPVKKGVFGADMKIEQTNDGPVTIIIESK